MSREPDKVRTAQREQELDPEIAAMFRPGASDAEPETPVASKRVTSVFELLAERAPPSAFEAPAATTTRSAFEEQAPPPPPAATSVRSAFGPPPAAPEIPVRQVVRREVIPGLPAPQPRLYFYQGERYFQCFINASRSGVLAPGRIINFDEARQAVRNTPGLSPQTTFLAMPVFDTAETLEEHRAGEGGRGWDSFVQLALETREEMYFNYDLVLEVSCVHCRDAALNWCGMAPSTASLDRERFRSAYELADAKSEGLAAALLDANLYHCSEQYGRRGMALSLMRFRLGSFDKRWPSLPVENFIFDRGFNAKTAMLPVVAPGRDDPCPVPLLDGSYRVADAHYISALGRKGDRTGGDTMGWRQLSMEPLDVEHVAVA